MKSYTYNFNDIVKVTATFDKQGNLFEVFGYDSNGHFAPDEAIEAATKWAKADYAADQSEDRLETLNQGRDAMDWAKELREQD